MSAAAAASDVAWIATGSNLGRRGRNLARLRELLQREGVRLEAQSSEILTRPLGVTAQPDFHNQLLRLRAPEPWPAQRWLRHCRAAEAAAGRRETYPWGPRLADADILLLGPQGEVRVDEPGLSVPHPALADRPYLRRLLEELGVRWGGGPPAAAPA